MHIITNSKKHFIAGGFWLLLIMLAAPAYSQEGSVGFSSVRMEIAQALRTIEQQTGYVFSYQSEVMNLRSQVVFTRQNLPVKEAIEQILTGKNLDYMVRNKYIIIHTRFAPARPAAAPKPDDGYRPTDAAAIGASPLNRPVTETPVTARTAVNTTKQPAQPGYSLHYPPANWAPEKKNLPSFALKTNLLYGLGTLTPNLAAEIGTGRRTSLMLSGSYNPWGRIGTLDNNKKLVHWVVRPEFRYWFCERFNGQFMGVHAFYNQFNIGGHEIPFVNFKPNQRYEGYAWGGGINYGYHMPFGSSRWGLEFSAGAGVAVMEYKQLDCMLCSRVHETKNRTWFGPTHASVSLVFIIR